jgi:histidinol phosphatase-like enzyme
MPRIASTSGRGLTRIGLKRVLATLPLPMIINVSANETTNWSSNYLKIGKNAEVLIDWGDGAIDGIYYSTSDHKSDIFAKPNIGMFKRAEKEQKLSFKGGAFVGDSIGDLKAAEKAKALPILVKTGQGQETITKLNTFANRNLKKKTQIFENLWEFAVSLPWIE